MSHDEYNYATAPLREPSQASLESEESDNEPVNKRCYFFHRNNCRNGDACRFVHDASLLTPEGRDAYRREHVARKKACKKARMQLAQCASGFLDLHVRGRVMPLCPNALEGRCERVQCPLTHITPRFYYRAVTAGNPCRAQ